MARARRSSEREVYGPGPNGTRELPPPPPVGAKRSDGLGWSTAQFLEALFCFALLWERAEQAEAEIAAARRRFSLFCAGRMPGKHTTSAAAGARPGPPA